MTTHPDNKKRFQEIKLTICMDWKKLKVEDLAWLVSRVEILQARVEFLDEFYQKTLKERKF